MARSGPATIVPLLLVACSPQASDAPWSAGAGDAGTQPAEAGTPESAPAACPGPTPAPAADRATSMRLPIAMVVGGQPLVLGRPMPTGGGQLTLDVLKLFLAEPVLVDETGAPVEAQIVDAGGRPRPHGVLLVDAADMDDRVLHLATAPGRYVALRLGIGVPRACNGGDPTSRVFPLGPDGEMYWPWGSQYIFVRAEGAQTRNGETQRLVVHMGFDVLYSVVELRGALGAGQEPTLMIDVGALLDRPAESASNGGHLAPEMWVADNIVRTGVLSLRP